MSNPNRLHIWLLSPYHTGSHAAWANGYQAHSRHRVTLLTMAGRFWKWRMQGGAIELAAQGHSLLTQGDPPDAVLATDMVNLPAWLGLMRGRLPVTVPVVLYMHENQLTYPWAPGVKPDLAYAMINWLSQLSADTVLFNSAYHRQSWFEELPRLLKHFPDYNHLSLIDQAQRRSQIAPVGIDCAALTHVAARSPQPGAKPPLIVWNQRWEYDKRPDRFFRLLYRLDGADIPFRLAVAGENFRQTPDEFGKAQQRLAHRIVHWGYVESRTAYVQLLQQADLVISTAEHEFFGVSILEAICAGAFPLLPTCLSYPELIPPALHPACLYRTEEELFGMAVQRLTHPRPAPPSLRAHTQANYDWPVVAHQYDIMLEALAQR